MARHQEHLSRYVHAIDEVQYLMLLSDCCDSLVLRNMRPNPIAKSSAANKPASTARIRYSLQVSRVSQSSEALCTEAILLWCIDEGHMHHTQQVRE